MKINNLVKNRLLSRYVNILASVLLVFALVAGAQSAGASSLSTTASQSQLQFPIRAAFYYPWFPEAWTQKGITPYTNYHPSLGSYDSSNQTILKSHIAAMQYGGIQAGIASWWGQGSKTDNRIPALLQAAAGTSFQWSIYYEPEGQGDPSVAQITSDLTFIRDHYASNPGFLSIGGRFVIFVYADTVDGCGMADRWKQANTVNAYVVLKVFPGYKTCASQPDGWHQYSPAVAVDSQKGYSYAISPGFWKVGENPRLVRDLTSWNTNIRNMIASGAPFQLITTFNEWGEGTAIESASEWYSTSGYGAFFDALHNNGQTGSTPSSTPGTTGTPITANTPTSTSTNSAAVSFTPSADTFVDASNPTVNNGSLTQLRIDNSPVVNSFLRFDIQGLTGTVTKATLRLYANSSSTAGYQVYKVPDTSWGETTITYNTAPPLGSVASSMGAFNSAVWTTADITSMISGNGTISLAVTGNTSTAVSFVSREGGANAPQLAITTSGTNASPTVSLSITPTSTQVISPTNTPPQAFTSTPTGTNIPVDPTAGSLTTATNTLPGNPPVSSSATATNTPDPGPTATPTQTTAVISSPTSSSSITTSFLPSADAYTEASNPAVNNGTAKQLRIDNSPIIYSYLRFVVQGLNGTVTKAILKVFANSSSSAGYQVYGIPDISWDEKTITFNNAPPFGSTVGSMGGFKSGVWTAVDITSLINGNGTFSLGLAGKNNTAVNFVSREGGANAPQLVITLNGTVASPTNGVAPTPASTQAVGPTNTPTQVSASTPTGTSIPVNPTFTPTQGVLPTDTPTQLSGPTSTGTSIPGSPAPTSTQGISPTDTATQAFSPTDTATQAVNPTPTGTSLPSSPTPTSTQVISPTNTPTASPSPTATATKTPTFTPTSTPVPTNTPGTTTIQHVFVVVMENHSYNEVWNTSSSPYITSLGNSFARATNYHASIHPSLPNYLELYGGSNYGITTDCNPSTSCHVSATSLADNLEAKGLTWKGYEESMPSPCFLTTSGTYAPKHNPFVYFDDIRNNTTRCASHVVPYTALAADLSSASTTPNFALITPNLCNDMHDCSVATGDNWLKSNLPAILNSSACTVDKCLLILTWDEDDSSQSNQVLTIFAGSAAKTGGVTSTVSYSHYSMLRTVENIFGLTTQTSNDAGASPMTDLYR